MSKLNAGREVPLSLDPDKADKSGFLHGVRATMRKVRAILYNYANKDGVGATNDDGSEVQAPGIMVEFQVQGGETYNQFYSNGSADQRIPNKKGTGFVLAPGSMAKSGLTEGGNAYQLIASLKGCGWPTDKLGDLSGFDGTVVDLIAQPVGETKRALAEGKKARTIAVVGKIVKYPEGVTEDADEDTDETEEETPAPVKKSKPAPVEAEDDDEDDEDEAPPVKAKKAKPVVEEDEDEEEEEEEDEEDESDADPLVTEAQEFVATVLQSKKYAGKSIDLPTLSKEVLMLAKTNKNRQKIVALVQDPAFHKAEGVVWAYDKKTKSISLED